MQRIHIMGAAGVGTTTLGRDLAQVLPHTHLDTDDYFWHTKFTKQRPCDEREALLRIDLQSPPWLLTGGVAGWADSVAPLFDLVIFLWIPEEIRMARLQKREHERFGDQIEPGGVLHEQSQTFLKWASSYDTSRTETRSRFKHERWLSQLSCPVLRLEEDLTRTQRVEAVTAELGFWYKSN